MHLAYPPNHRPTSALHTAVTTPSPTYTHIQQSRTAHNGWKNWNHEFARSEADSSPRVHFPRKPSVPCRRSEGSRCNRGIPLTPQHQLQHLRLRNHENTEAGSGIQVLSYQQMSVRARWSNATWWERYFLRFGWSKASVPRCTVRNATWWGRSFHDFWPTRGTRPTRHQVARDHFTISGRPVGPKHTMKTQTINRSINGCTRRISYNSMVLCHVMVGASHLIPS